LKEGSYDLILNIKLAAITTVTTAILAATTSVSANKERSSSVVKNLDQLVVKVTGYNSIPAGSLEGMKK